MAEVLKQIFPLFSVIILTYLLKYFKLIQKKQLSPAVTQIAFDIVMPVLLFEVFSSVKLELNDFALPLVTITFSFLALFSLYFFNKVKSLKNKILLMVAYTGLNVAPIYPFVELNYDADIFSKFVLMDLGALVVLFTLAISIASISTEKKKLDIVESLKNIFWNPVMAAIFLGLLINALNINTPQLLSDTTAYVSASFGFLVSFIVGLNFEFPKEMKVFVRVGVLYLFRILLAISFAFVLLFFISDFAEIKEIILLILATPFAMLTVVYAERFKLDSTFAAQLVTLSLFIQILILPVIIWIGRNFI